MTTTTDIPDFDTLANVIVDINQYPTARTQYVHQTIFSHRQIGELPHPARTLFRVALDEVANPAEYHNLAPLETITTGTIQTDYYYAQKTERFDRLLQIIHNYSNRRR
jgi:hypothetical protein